EDHSKEWSSGVAAGTTAAFALTNGIAPYQLVDDLPKPERQLDLLKRQIEQSNNPIAFPDMSIFNQTWDQWR
ncbi:MAG: FAD-dependent oxidoreductase, partial [Cyanothece sp. SIO1E1]|nr:FAD-dependent oxidoreductase [Cyanothece sp. SIO1E1]